MKKLAIVSSYNESCGNASFTKCLHDSIEQYTGWDVEVIELKLSYLQSVDPFVRKMGDEHIANIVTGLKKYDAVNIQLENGLYGSLPRDVFRRVTQLASANKNTSVTVHSLRIISSDTCSFRKLISSAFKLEFKKAAKLYMNTQKNKFLHKLNKRMVSFFLKNNIKIITHTKRAYDLIKDGFKYPFVYVHPLCFFEHKPQQSLIIKSLNKVIGEEESTVKIGVFGYISSYKGLSDAIMALKHLPSNYKLLIFGRQHPQTILSNGKVDEYLRQLMSLAENRPPKKPGAKAQEEFDVKFNTEQDLKGRIFFVGELDDEQFVNAIHDVDMVWLPYYENGQDASGIAALCVKYAKRVLCSSSFAFDEMFKFFKPTEKVMRFDIGNYIEMAQKTQLMMDMHLTEELAYDSAYVLETQANLYTEIFDKN